MAFFLRLFFRPLQQNWNVSDLQESALADGKPSFSFFSCLGLVLRVSIYPGNKTLPKTRYSKCNKA